jgi:hypothetical protein
MASLSSEFKNQLSDFEIEISDVLEVLEVFPTRQRCRTRSSTEINPGQSRLQYTINDNLAHN